MAKQPKPGKGSLEQHDVQPSPPIHVIVDHTEVPGLEYQAASNRPKGLLNDCCCRYLHCLDSHLSQLIYT